MKFIAAIKCGCAPEFKCKGSIELYDDNGFQAFKVVAPSEHNVLGGGRFVCPTDVDKFAAKLIHHILEHKHDWCQ